MGISSGDRRRVQPECPRPRVPIDVTDPKPTPGVEKRLACDLSEGGQSICRLCSRTGDLNLAGYCARSHERRPYTITQSTSIT